MKALLRTIAAGVVGACLATAATAGDSAACTAAAKAASAQTGAECTKAEGASAQNPFAARLAAAGAPLMECKVGDTTTNCPIEAFTLATKTGAAATYCVAGKTYTDFAEATKAWAGALSRRLEEITTVQYAVGDSCTYCPDEAKAASASSGAKVRLMLASHEYSCADSVKSAAVAALKAADAVPFAMFVGDTECACPAMAARLSRVTGAPITYAVDGQKVNCELLASCFLNARRVLAASDSLRSGWQG